MLFSAGKILPILLLLGVAAFVLLASRLTGSSTLSQHPDFIVWTFSPDRVTTYRDSIDVAKFESITGRRVFVRLMSPAVLNLKLASLIDLNQPTDALPDAVEIELSYLGRYFTAQETDARSAVGLLPLDDLLSSSDATLSPARLENCRFLNSVFALPLDVHPVTITYRPDLFLAAGIDIEKATTWTMFIAACQAYQKSSDKKTASTSGIRIGRRALGVQPFNSELAMMILNQRGISLIDSTGKSRLKDQHVLDVASLCARMIASDGITLAHGAADDAWASDLDSGKVAAIITPDWRAQQLTRLAPKLAGKVRMMPLPVLDPLLDVPTSTWGGTVIAIPLHARSTTDSLTFLRVLYLESQQPSELLSANTAIWPKQPLADAFFSGQDICQLQTMLAARVKPRATSSNAVIAQSLLADVIWRASELAEADRGKWLIKALTDADAELSRRIEFRQRRSH